MKTFKLLIALIALSFSTQAQVEMTLEECVILALENNLNLQQSQIAIEQSIGDYEQSKLEKLPSINASTGHTWNFGRSLDFTTYEFSNQSLQSNNVGLNAGATLYNGGRIKNTIKLQDLIVGRNESSLKTLKENIAIDVAARFLDVLVRKEQKKVAENTVSLRNSDLDRINLLIENGINAASTRYDTEAQLSNSEFQVIQADNALQMSLLFLKQAMNVDPSTDLDIITPNLNPPTQAELAGLSPDVVYPAALLNQGSIEGASKAEEIAALQIDLAGAQRLPSISVNGGMNSYHSSQGQELDGVQTFNNVPFQGVTTVSGEALVQQVVEVPTFKDSPLFTQFKDNFAQSLGLNISIPIFNKGQITNSIRRAELDLENAKLSSKIEEQALRQRIENAWMDAQLAYRQHEAAKVQLEAQKKAADFTKKRYDIGVGGQYEYFAAQNNVTASELQVTQAKYDLIYKVKILEFYKDNTFTF